MIELDPAVGKGTVGVEEKSAIGERKLESGVGGVLWPVRASVGMMRLVRMTRLVGRTGLVGRPRFARMIGPVRRFGLARVVRMVRRLGFTGGMGFGVTVRGALPARRLDLFGFGPNSILFAFQMLVGIKRGLYRSSAFRLSRKVEGCYP